jgi:polysaccharide export outer membrane protein
MKPMICLLLVLGAAIPAMAQQETAQRVGAGATSVSEVPNLPVEKVGPNDLLGIAVYDSPELSRAVRVESDGAIRLPMVKQRIQVAGLYPAEVEKEITKALLANNVLVDPVVTVFVLEYQSRPITVAGAVKNPLTFQATGTVSLLDAVSRAQGLTENAGSEILVSRQVSGEDGKPAAVVRRVPVRGLLDGTDPSLNLNLHGGEVIRVPEAGRIYVVGDVKKSGAFYITDGSQSSVLKALALSEGLDGFCSHHAYIYRVEESAEGRKEIPIELKKIMDRKSPDVPLLAGDILYIPNATGARASLKVLEESVGIGTALSTAFIIYGAH